MATETLEARNLLAASVLPGLQLPLAFEVNAGQATEDVDFLARGSGYTMLLAAGETILSLRPSQSRNDSVNDGDASEEPLLAESSELRLQLVGSQRETQTIASGRLDSTSNYLLGNDPSQWLTNLSQYREVRYKEVYPGIDQVFYGNAGNLQFDFVVAPHVNPGVIGLNFEGAQQLEIDETGDLLITIDGKTVVQQAPVLYQTIGGVRQIVSGNYVLQGPTQAGFAIGAYDVSRELTIDPTLAFATYVGGTGTDAALGIAHDDNGDIYLAGYSNSALSGAGINTIPGTTRSGNDVFVTKMNASGTTMYWTAFLGGSGDDRAYGIAVQADSGEAYLTGATSSTNFPTMQSGTPGEAIQPTFRGGTWDGFVAKLNADGSGLVFSTYLGGSGDENAAPITLGGAGIALDSAGSAWVTGMTTSPNFATTASAFQPTHNGSRDAFVTRINSTGTAITYSSYLGGNSDDRGASIAVDAADKAYVTGSTFSGAGSVGSVNFPVTSGVAQNFNRGDWEVFVAKVDPLGAAGAGTLAYSTLLGGINDEHAQAIAVDNSGKAYVTGLVQQVSAGYPVVNPLQATGAGSWDAFVTVLNPTATAIHYSTRYGGSGDDRGQGIAVDASGNAYVTGMTTSVAFPVANAIHTEHGGGTWDAFALKLNASGSAVYYSTLLGGNGDDRGQAVVLDDSGAALIGGLSSSGTTTLPTTTGVLQGSNAGGYDAFAARITDDGNHAPTLPNFGTIAVNKGATVNLNFGARDPDAGNTLSYSIANAPAGSTFNTATGAFTWEAPTSDAVSWWRAEGNSQDAQGAHNGTLLGGTSFATGKVGQAFSFDGTDDAMETSTTSVMNSLPLTLEAWVRPALRMDGTVFPSNVFSNDAPGNFGHGFGVNVFPGGSHFVVEFQDGFHTVFGVDFEADEWYHVAAVYTAGNVKVYVNGEQVDSVDYVQGPLDGAAVVRLGKHNDDTLTFGTERFFKGLIDEPAVFNRALSAGEVAAIAAAGSAGKLAVGYSKTFAVKASDGTTAPAAPSGLVNTWSGEGNADGTPGNTGTSAINGTMSGVSFAPGITGASGQAFDFSGTGGHVSIPHSADINFTASQNYSLDFWMKSGPIKAGQHASLLEKWNGTGGYPYIVRLNSNGTLVTAAWDQTNNPGVSSGRRVDDNQWHHISAVFTHEAANGVAAKTIQLFVDGQLEGSTAYTALGTISNSQPLTLGMRGSLAAATDYSGLLDELSIYNRALSAAEVQQLAAVRSADTQSVTLIVNGETAPGLPTSSASTTAATSPTFPAGTAFSGFISQTSDALGNLAGQGVTYRGTGNGGSTESLPGGARLVYRHRLDYDAAVEIAAVTVGGAGFNGGTAVLRLLDSNGIVIASTPTSGGNAYRTHTLTLTTPAAGSTFFVDEFDTSSTWRYRDRLSVAAVDPLAPPPALTPAGTQAGSALRFDGINDWVGIADAGPKLVGSEMIDALHPTSDLTMAGWFKLESFANEWQALFIKQNPPTCSESGCSSREYGLFINKERTLHMTATSANNIGVTQTSFDSAALDLEVDHWYNFAVAISANDNLARVYLNGDQVASGFFDASGFRDTNGPLRFSDPDHPLHGSLDNFSLWHRALSQDEIRSLMHTPLVGTETDLRGYWRFDEGSGTRFADATANANDGYLNGVLREYPGALGGALDGSNKAAQFDGGQIALTIPQLNTASGTTNTVSFWMNWDGSNSIMPIGFASYDLWLVNGHFGFNTGVSDLYGVSSGGLNDRWVHVTAVFPNNPAAINPGNPLSEFKLYIDGVAQSLTQRLGATNTSQVITTNTTIGGWPVDANHRWRGGMDEVAFFSRTLSAVEVAAQFNNRNSAYSTVVAGQGPVAYYRLDGTADASFLADSSASNPANNGVISSSSNMPTWQTSTAPLYDTTPGPITVTVTNTADQGPGSLRDALERANALALGTEVTIQFQIPSSDPHFVDVDERLAGGDAGADVFLIQPIRPLPSIGHSSLTIDGGTQTSFAAAGGNTSALGPEIVLDGQGLAGGSGLLISRDGATISGLNVQRFKGDGIRAEGIAGSWIFGNYVGTDATGTIARGNTLSGISIVDGWQNVIGTDGNAVGDTEERNVIAANSSAAGGSGVTLSGGPTVHNLSVVLEMLAGSIPSFAVTGTVPVADIVDPSGIAVGNWQINYPAPGGGGDHFGMIARGRLHVLVGGTYSLAMGNDDGGRLRINLNGLYDVNGEPLPDSDQDFDDAGETLIVRDTLTAFSVRYATVTLAPGFYDFEWLGMESTQSAGFELSVAAGGGNVSAVNAANGWHVLGEASHSSFMTLHGGKIDVTTYYAAASNIVAGNFLGTNAAGSAALGNAVDGVTISGSRGNRLGTNGDGLADAEERNIISGNAARGLLITGVGAAGNKVGGNYFGSDVTGLLDLGNNSNGILINGGARHNIIGTDGSDDDNLSTGGIVENFNDAERNVVSGNASAGILVQNAGTNENVIAGNYIGLNKDGMAALANGGNAGVRIAGGAQRNRVGTNADGIADAQERNVISGNTGRGVQLDGSGTSFNRVSGNYIGLNKDGTAAIGNSLSGVEVNASASHNTIGTDGDGSGDGVEGNVIAGNTAGGTSGNVQVNGALATIIAGNLIGTNALGTAAIATPFSGIRIVAGSKLTRVGTDGDGQSDAAERNVVAGHGQTGVLISDAGTDLTIVAGNLIGTDIHGTLPLGNGDYGVLVRTGALYTRVGTNADGISDALERNVIVANGGALVRPGVFVQTVSSLPPQNTVVAGNYIGVGADGVTALGNASDGVQVAGAQATYVGSGGVSQGQTYTVKIDPKSAYLRTSNDPLTKNAAPLLLADYGLAPGDWVVLEQLGDRVGSNGGADNGIALAGVFSTSNALLASSLQQRVPGAVSAGGTPQGAFNTFNGGLPTDIAEDFVITTTVIQVPAGATHLFVATPDSAYSDNSDPDSDFALRIRPLKAGVAPVAGNLIGNNAGAGVALTASSTGNVVVDNTYLNNVGEDLAITGTSAAANIAVTTSSIAVNAATLVTYGGVGTLSLSQSASLSFVLTDFTDVAELEDDATAANTRSQLTSVNGTFATTRFVNPTTSLNIDLGADNDDISILLLDSLANIPNITIDGASGNDHFFEAFEGSVTLQGGAGNDTYQLQGSIVTVVDNGGEDVYSIDGDSNAQISIHDQGSDGDDYEIDGIDGAEIEISDQGGGDSYTETADGLVTVTITDLGAGSDSYFLEGSIVTVTDNGGEDVYSIDGQDGADISIDDQGTDSDDYEIGGIDGAEIEISDQGGGDRYTETADGLVTVTITDLGAGSDSYFLEGSIVTVTDNGGEDVYNIDGQDGADISINDQGTSSDDYEIGGIDGAEIEITDQGGGDSYTETADGLVTVTITDLGAGRDSYFLEGSIVTVTDNGGEDVYSIDGQDGADISIDDQGTDSDDYAIGGIDGAEIEISDQGGGDRYTETADGLVTVTITDLGAGSDSYFLEGSIVTVTDNGGEDVYNIDGQDGADISIDDQGTDSDDYEIGGIDGAEIEISDQGGGDRYTETADGLVTVTITDLGAGSDSYFLEGSIVTVTDNGGEDVYSIDGQDGADISIADQGTDSDDYEIGGIDGAEIEISDQGGGDRYTETADGLVTVTITDLGAGSDSYFLEGSIVTVTDNGGEDVYNIDGQDGADISIDDQGGDSDDYEIGGIDGAEVEISDQGGGDRYTETADGLVTVTITDLGAGSDTYFLEGSIVTVTDNGGEDVYSIDGQDGADISIDDQGTDSDDYEIGGIDGAEIEISDRGGGDRYTETADGLVTVTITDLGAGSDSYFLDGSIVTVTDNGGEDVYSIDGQDGADISIADQGGDSDDYEIGGIDGAEIEISDQGGGDRYTETADGLVTVTITDFGTGDDQYDLEGSQVVVSDLGGNDTYQLSPKPGSAIGVTDLGGADVFDFSASLGASVTTTQVATDAGNQAFGLASFVGGGTVTIGNPTLPSTANATLVETIIGSVNGDNAITAVQNDKTVGVAPVFAPQTVVGVGTANTLTLIKQENDVQIGEPIVYNITGDVVTTTEDTLSGPVDILANDFGGDQPPDDLNITGPTIVTGLGTVSGDCRSIVYNPGSHYNYLAVGETAIVIVGCSISDASGFTAVSGLTVRIEGRNDSPTANPDFDSTDEDTVKSVFVLSNDTDPDKSDVLTVTMISGSGGVSTDGTVVTYDPGHAHDHLSVGQQEIVLIQYTISDPHGAISASTLSLTIHGRNDAPTPSADENTTSEDLAVATLVLTNDSDPDEIFALEVVGASLASGSGAVSFTGNSVTFDPQGFYNHLAVGQSAIVVIDYVVRDELGAVGSAQLTVTVGGTNDAPTAADHSFGAGEDTPRVIPLASLVAGATDVDTPLANLSAVIATQPLHGSVTVGGGGEFVYTPQPGYTGADSFTYRTSDGSLTSAPATVSLEVAEAPRVVDVVARFGADLSKSYSLLGNTRNLPWINISAIDIVFSENVAIDTADVQLQGIATSNYSGTLSYNSSSKTARLSLAAPLSRDRLTLKLDGDSSSADGNAGVAAVDAVFLKGGDYSLGFNVLAGDTISDGVINVLDNNKVKTSMPAYGAYDLFADLDGDNDVDVTDFNESRRRLGWKLP